MNAASKTIELSYSPEASRRLRMHHSIGALVAAILFGASSYAAMYLAVVWQRVNYFWWMIPFAACGLLSAMLGVISCIILMLRPSARVICVLLIIANGIFGSISVLLTCAGIYMWIMCTRFSVQFSK